MFVVTILAATPFQVGLINAAQFLLYLLPDLFADVLVDRRRRKPIDNRHYIPCQLFASPRNSRALDEQVYYFGKTSSPPSD